MMEDGFNKNQMSQEDQKEFERILGELFRGLTLHSKVDEFEAVLNKHSWIVDRIPDVWKARIVNNYVQKYLDRMEKTGFLSLVDGGRNGLKLLTFLIWSFFTVTGDDESADSFLEVEKEEWAEVKVKIEEAKSVLESLCKSYAEGRSAGKSYVQIVLPTDIRDTIDEFISHDAICDLVDVENCKGCPFNGEVDITWGDELVLIEKKSPNVTHLIID